VMGDEGRIGDCITLRYNGYNGYMIALSESCHSFRTLRVTDHEEDR
jgi:hypothetical protein